MEPNVIEKLNSYLVEEVTSLFQHFKVVMKQKKNMFLLLYDHAKLRKLNKYIVLSFEILRITKGKPGSLLIYKS
jgi:hypothetical protein